MLFFLSAVPLGMTTGGRSTNRRLIILSSIGLRQGEEVSYFSTTLDTHTQTVTDSHKHSFTYMRTDTHATSIPTYILTDKHTQRQN